MNVDFFFSLREICARELSTCTYFVYTFFQSSTSSGLKKWGCYHRSLNSPQQRNSKHWFYIDSTENRHLKTWFKPNKHNRKHPTNKRTPPWPGILTLSRAHRQCSSEMCSFCHKTPLCQNWNVSVFPGVPWKMGWLLETHTLLLVSSSGLWSISSIQHLLLWAESCSAAGVPVTVLRTPEPAWLWGLFYSLFSSFELASVPCLIWNKISFKNKNKPLQNKYLELPQNRNPEFQIPLEQVFGQCRIYSA